MSVYESVLAGDPMSRRDVVKMDSPIATLMRCSSQLFLCIGEVIDITVDSRHADQVTTDYLTEPSVFISYQMLDAQHIAQRRLKQPTFTRGSGVY